MNTREEAANVVKLIQLCPEKMSDIVDGYLKAYGSPTEENHKKVLDAICSEEFVDKIAFRMETLFSAQEISEINAFYSSETGKKFMNTTLFNEMFTLIVERVKELV